MLFYACVYCCRAGLRPAPTRLWGGEEVEGEEVLGVGPGCLRDEAGRGGGGLKLFHRKLVRVLGDHDLVRGEGEGAPAEADGLRAQAFDADRHAARAFLVDGAVPEGGEIEIGAELAVGAHEDVGVKGGAGAGGVVVGGYEDDRI